MNKKTKDLVNLIINDNEVKLNIDKLVNGLFNELSINKTDIKRFYIDNDNINIIFDNDMLLEVNKNKYNFKAINLDFLLFNEFDLTIKQARKKFSNTFNDDLFRKYQRDLIVKPIDICGTFNSLIEESKNDLVNYGIPFNDDIPIEINTRTSSSLGRCWYKRTNNIKVAIKIDICFRYIRKATRQQIKDTIVHELLHSCNCVDCGHGGKWLEYAKRVNQLSNGYYNISRCEDFDYNI